MDGLRSWYGGSWRRLSLFADFAREEQGGFRIGRGCVSRIFTLRQLLERRFVFLRPTIILSPDIYGAFHSVDRFALWYCLLNIRVPENYALVPVELFLDTLGRCLQWSTTRLPRLLNFSLEEFLQNALSGPLDGEVELLPRNRVSGLGYALWGEAALVIQRTLDRLVTEVSRYCICFAPSKCKVILQAWQEPVFALTVCGSHLEVVNTCKYLGSSFREPARIMTTL